MGAHIRAGTVPHRNRAPARRAGVTPQRNEYPWVGRLPRAGLEIALFNHPERERKAPWLALWEGRYGPKRWLIAPALSWSSDSCEALEASDWIRPDQSPGPSHGGNPQLTISPFTRFVPFGEAALSGTIRPWSAPLAPSPLEALWMADPTPHDARAAKCLPWNRPRPAMIARYNGEWEQLRLLECDGSVSSDTIDRLSVLARPALRERPSLPLPIDPQPGSDEHEWLPQLKLVHPRLAWVLRKIADAFPGRMITLMSGYRPESRPESLHRQGRALDISVRGISNEAVFRFCRTLPRVGCGYYPNNHFVHVDVRPPTRAEAFWVDVSGPGEPSRYVDSWPGVVTGGALEWAGVD